MTIAKSTLDSVRALGGVCARDYLRTRNLHSLLGSPLLIRCLERSFRWSEEGPTADFLLAHALRSQEHRSAG